MTNDVFRQYEANFALGKLYWQQKQEKETITHLEMAREIAEKHGLLRQERDTVAQLIQCNESPVSTPRLTKSNHTRPHLT